jgi:hypothetical protein
MRRTDHLDKRPVRRYDETGFLLQFTDQVEVVAITWSLTKMHPIGKSANETPSCHPGFIPRGTPDVVWLAKRTQTRYLVTAGFRELKNTVL